MKKIEYSKTIDIYSSGRELKNRLHEMALEAPVLGHSCLLFRNFTDMLYSEKFKDRCQIGALLTSFLIEDILRDGDYAQIPYDLKGVPSAVTTLISELREGEFTPELLLNIGQMGSSISLKAKILSEIMTKYELKLSEMNFYDEVLKKRAIIQALEDGEQFSTISDLDTIYLHNLYDISSLDFRLIYNLSKRVKIKVELPYDPERQDAFRFLETAIRRFEYLGEHAPNIDLNFGYPEYLEPANSIQFLQKNIFKFPPPEPQQADSTVEIIEEHTFESELRSVVRRIKALINSGVKPIDIAILIENFSKYHESLSTNFRDYGIPVTFYGSICIKQFSLYSLLSIPFKIYREHFSFPILLELLTSPFIDRSVLTESGATLSPSKLNEIAVALSYFDESREPIESALNRVNLENSDMLLFKEIVASIKRLMEPFNFDRTKPAQIYKNFKNFVEFLNIRESIVKIKLPDPSESLKALHENMYALELFLKSVEELSSCYKLTGKTPSMSEFSTFLDDIASNIGVIPPQNSEGVRVLDWSEIPGQKFKYIFAISMCDGDFPTDCYENHILSDAEKRELTSSVRELKKQFTYESFSSRERRAALNYTDRVLADEIVAFMPFKSVAMKYWEQSYLFLSALEAAEEKIYFSSHRRDISGKTSLPSYFLEQIKLILNFPEHVEDKTTPLNVDELFHLALKDPVIYEYLYSNPEYRDTLRLIEHGIEIEKLRESTDNLAMPYMGQLSDRSNLRRVALKGSNSMRAFSATALELYLHCPFLYLAKYIFLCELIGAPQRSTKPNILGTIMHKLLEIYYTEYKNNLTPDVEQLFEKIVKEEENREIIGDLELWNSEKKKLKSGLINWIEYEKEHIEGYAPLEFEYSFGGESSAEYHKKLSISGKMEEVWFRGSIDRVDLGSDSIRIVDYKNSRDGSKSYAKKIANPGVKGVQIPLYRAVAMELLKERYPIESKRSYGRYALIPKAEFLPKTDRMDESEEFKNYFTPLNSESNERNFFKDLSHIITELRSGKFAPSGEDCSYCEFGDLCRFEG